MEVRSLQTPPRSDGRKLSGYAARFNAPSQVIAEKGKVFREVILPGAFARTLAAPIRGSVVALWNHGRDNRPPLARMPGTLRLWEDALGLGFEFEAPAAAADVVEAVARGDVWGMSFGFLNEKARWYSRDGLPWRDLSALDLLEISLVIDPAYPATSVNARDLAGVSRVEIPELGSPPHLARARRLQAIAERI